LSVSVRIGGNAAAAARADQAQIGPAAAISDQRISDGEARLILDETYSNRTGYKADFLQTVNVPMPQLSAAQKRVAAKNKERLRGDSPHALRYEHFSVVMNGARRLAFFTATNIDGAHAKDFDRKTGKISDASGLTRDDQDEAAEAAEQWFRERRIEDREQTPADLYADQTTFDASGRPILDRRTSAHRNRMFQQGHLTRRQDPLWGADSIVIRANADTFHVTNRAPQIGYFNMGTRKREGEAKHPGGELHWRALEDYVLENARADRQRVTVFTGPVFDDRHDFSWSRGRADMKGFKVPRKFWKVVLRVDKGRLHATALLADQSPLIDHLPEMVELGDEEARRIAFEKVAKYQVRIAELERQTGLDFGNLVRAVDTFVAGGRGPAMRRVEKLQDVSMDRRRPGAHRVTLSTDETASQEQEKAIRLIAVTHTSTLAASAFSWMNSRRGSTMSPMSLVKMSSASSISFTLTCSSERALASSVVSHS
jgi:endonuclease G